jgi:hypothetical protein
MHAIKQSIEQPLLLAVTLILTSLPATANESPGKFELTPFAAYRGGGDFEDLNGTVEANTQWEVLYASQSTSVDITGAIPDESAFDLDVEYLHVGGTYLFDGDRVRPFIAATIGASHFEPQPSGFGSETFVSGSIGGGWKISLGKTLALRVEARGYATLVDNDSRLFCESSDAGGSCLLILEGSLFTQWETRAGLTFRF